MFPIRDHNPSERTPYVTYTLLALNVLMFVLTQGWSDQFNELWARLALYPLAVIHGDMTWGLVTHMFLHAGFLHILGNMLFLWIFGDNLEDQMGHVGFLLFYLACGLLAAFAQILPDAQSGVPMVGASGAIAGVMGAYLLLFPRARVDILVIIIIIIRIFTIPAWVMLGLWFGLQIFGGFTTLGAEEGVAYWAHAGGFVAGAVLALPLFLRRGGTAYWQFTDGHPPHPAVKYPQSRIPQVRR
ncbi:rhomboid family intramembrane serine protease [Paracoccus tegillarcae]|uniref:Rhomboid family intramembrane serine protease n=1 Tax=Paracoccus tegillarcae TaxID=1529068 RepID=A0A2K9F4P5_9RHOB|nr:rhomboid family intramembrane serine protease [Paracoccus tegillarcae]AUH35372.1 rhomboid family intramembrane serine protease [Paracoccus tegillarcae]